MHGTTLFTRRGDITLAWDEPDDPQILAMIEAQMRAGVTFFLIEPRLGGMAAPHKIPLHDARDALRNRTVAMSVAGKDVALLPVLEAGAARPVATPDKPVRARKKAASAKEVASGESIGVRAAGGG